MPSTKDWSFTMSDALNRVYESIDHENRHLPAATRRQIITGAAATLGTMGLLGLPELASAASKKKVTVDDPQTILNVAATAEVLATIVNTVGYVQTKFTDTPGTTGTGAITKRNIGAAAKEELTHYDVLVSLGGKPVTKRIFVPDSVFADQGSANSATGLLPTVIVGDQIFINAYLIATTVFGLAGNGKLARAASEFMGTEAVHRAVARQSLGLLGNDRVFIKFNQSESAPGPLGGLPGFTDVTSAVTELEAVGFGFGKQGMQNGKPVVGKFYEFDLVRPTTNQIPESSLNTRSPDNARFGTPVKKKPVRRRRHKKTHKKTTH